MQEHEEEVSEVGFVPYFDDIAVEYDANTTVDVQLHDGSHMRLRKLHEDYEPTDKVTSVKMLMEAHDKGEVLTGVFYIDTQKTDFTTMLNMVDEPLATLPQERTRPGRDVLAALMQAHL
jgi:2-oxoglutarate ferredoxin oxidoreductase subunit beta